MPRILIVDDDADHCEVVSRLLQKAGHTTRCAANGWEALISLDTEHIDLVVLDLMMPGMDGGTFLNILRNDQRRKHLPVLVVSAMDPRQLDEQIKMQGFQRYFRKAEFKLAELMSAVQTHALTSGGGTAASN
ncbi:MAG TPA: response regulator [Tepidisphaeraceae bacterium]|jgi:CheY-like chemotaxis protein